MTFGLKQPAVIFGGILDITTFLKRFSFNATEMNGMLSSKLKKKKTAYFGSLALGNNLSKQGHLTTK